MRYYVAIQEDDHQFIRQWGVVCITINQFCDLVKHYIQQNAYFIPAYDLNKMFDKLIEFSGDLSGYEETPIDFYSQEPIERMTVCYPLSICLYKSK